MRISAKTRYGLAAMISMSENYPIGECVTIISLAEKLKISKIYLEQVFSLLKRAGVVVSTKGAQGGYQLARMPKDITAFDILSAIETGLFEKTETTVLESNRAIEKSMQKIIFDDIDQCLRTTLLAISLDDLANEVKNQSSDEGYMYYL